MSNLEATTTNAAIEASLKTYQLIWPIVISILSAAVGIIGTLMIIIYNSNKEKQSEQDKRIEKVETDLKQLPYTYVMREDFVRAVTGLDMKVDKMTQQLGELNTNVVKLVAGGEQSREHV